MCPRLPTFAMRFPTFGLGAAPQWRLLLVIVVVGFLEHRAGWIAVACHRRVRRRDLSLRFWPPDRWWARSTNLLLPPITRTLEHCPPLADHRPGYRGAKEHRNKLPPSATREGNVPFGEVGCTLPKIAPFQKLHPSKNCTLPKIAPFQKLHPSKKLHPHTTCTLQLHPPTGPSHSQADPPTGPSKLDPQTGLHSLKLDLLRLDTLRLHLLRLYLLKLHPLRLDPSDCTPLVGLDPLRLDPLRLDPLRLGSDRLRPNHFRPARSTCLGHCHFRPMPP